MSTMHYLSDTLTRLRNGLAINLYNVKVLNSKLIQGVLKVLYKEGYIQGYKLNTKFNNGLSIEKYLEVFLKYDNYNIPVIKSLTVISKPGLRKYVSVSELLSLYKTKGDVNSLYILTTSHGILSDKDAILQHTGGELLCKIN